MVAKRIYRPGPNHISSAYKRPKAPADQAHVVSRNLTNSKANRLKNAAEAALPKVRLKRGSSVVTGADPLQFTQGVDLDLSPSTANWTEVGSLPGTLTRNEDVTDYTIGGNAIALSVSGAAEAGIGRALVAPTPNGVDSQFALWAATDFTAAAGTSYEFFFYIYSSPGNGLRIKNSITASTCAGWACIKFPPLDLIESSGVSNDFPGARVGFTSNPSLPCWEQVGTGFDTDAGLTEVWISAVNFSTSYNSLYAFRIGAVTLDYRQRPIIMLGFDDGRTNVKTQLCNGANVLALDPLDPLFGQDISTMDRCRALDIPFCVPDIRDNTGGFTRNEIIEIAENYPTSEIITHGSDKLNSVVFTTAQEAVNDGYGVSWPLNGGYTNGDSMRYNQEQLAKSGTDAGRIGRPSRGHVAPNNDNGRNSGIAWQYDMLTEANSSFDYVGTAAPGYPYFDMLTIEGDQKFEWGSFPRMNPENADAIPTYDALINNTIGIGVIRMGCPVWLNAHSMIVGGTNTLPPGEATVQYYVDDMATLINYLHREAHAGSFELMTTTTFYERMAASGVPRGIIPLVKS